MNPIEEKQVSENGNYEPSRPSVRENLLNTVKILVAAGLIMLLAWFVDKSVS